MKVVISGSRSIRCLPEEAKARIDRIVALGAHILIGDAPGVDAEVQRYLKVKGYRRVTIFYVGNRSRNNAGFKAVQVQGRYTDRDRYMCHLADYGLAIWDGRSIGTKANINRVKSRVVMA